MRKIAGWINKNKMELAVALVVFVVAVIPRVDDLGVFLTADEKNWIGRSYEFVKAFKDWRFNEMLQTTHPGVTTLWMSGVAVTAKMLLAHIPFSFRNLFHFVAVAQLPVAVVNALMVSIIYCLLRALLKKRWLAIVAALFLALNPVLVGYSRVVHVDALLGSFLFAAALATILYGMSGFDRRWLVVSAVLAALALLTKAPAVFIVPYLLLVILMSGKNEIFKKQWLIDRGRDIVLWGLLVGILIVVIWPAILWVPNPEGNVLVLKRDIGRAAVTPHHMVEDYRVNSSYYLFTLLTRTTPMVQFLVIVLLGWMGWSTWRRREGEDKQKRRIMWLLVAFVFFFVVMMMLGAKKGDRYILPVFFALDVLAAYGLWILASAVSRRLKIRNPLALGGTPRQRRGGKAETLGKPEIRNKKPETLLIFKVLSIILVGYLAITVFSYHPYNIAYSNPFYPDNLSQELGWGEGLEQVGAWLSENDPEAVVASWYPEELGAYTSAHVAHINAHEQSRVKYIVLYHNMFGRAPDHYANNFIDEYYKKREPVFVAEVVGKPYAWVYEKKVYDKVLPEMKSGSFVSQGVEVENENLAGVDVMVATYSGEAQIGQVVVNIVDQRDGEVIEVGRKPMIEIEDKGWTNFIMNDVLGKKGEFKVEVQIGDVKGKGPTIRYNAVGEYRETEMVINGQEKPGDLAIRLRYKVDGEIATEDDVKLLR